MLTFEEGRPILARPYIFLTCIMDARDGPLDTRVKDIVQSKSALMEDGGVLTIEPSATVYECIDRMVDRDVGSIVVIDGEAIAGIFTERDYMRNIALEGRSSDETEVREVMTSDVATVEPEKSLVECLHLMTQLRCRHLPVVDDETLVGLVSIGDGVKHIVKTAERETARLRDYVTGSYRT
jgi:CBS domain-containing protein